jgi:hypothetical protein
MIKLFTVEEYKNAKSREKLALQCYYCNQIFCRPKRYISGMLNENSRHMGKYCSASCAQKASIKLKKLNCLTCKKEFYKKPSEIKRTKNHFCTRSCAVTYSNTHKTKGFRRSKLEIWLEEKLILNYPNFQILFNSKAIIGSELDIYIPSLKLAFEINGIFHYKPIYGLEKLSQIQNNDSQKFQACLEQGIELCNIDISNLKHFKESSAEKFLEIIKNIISSNISL